MSGNSPNNLLLTLHRWASQQDENFVTDSFAHLLRLLCSTDPVSVCEVIEKLTSSICRPASDDATQIEIKTQISTEFGLPDLRIQWPGVCVIVEVKVESEADQSQLARYRRYLASTGAATTCLVFLTRYPVVFDSSQEIPDFNPRWYMVADWLQTEIDAGRIATPVGTYVTNQFIDFLRHRTIAMRQLTSDMASGVHSMTSLFLMLGEALNALGRQFKQARAIPYAGCYIDGQRFWVGISFDEPEVLYFATQQFHVDVAAVEKFDLGGKLVSSSWKGYSVQWRREFDMSPENKAFFGLTPSQQFDLLKEFIAGCLDDAAKIEVKSDPPV